MSYPQGTLILNATRGGDLARRGLQVASYHPYARTIQKAYKAYQYGKVAQPYVKSAVNMYRSRQRSRATKRAINIAKKEKAMADVGEDVGTSTAKHVGVTTSLANINPQTLYQTTLLNITKTIVAGDTLNRRMSDMVNFRGVKICMNFRVESAIGTTVAWLNVAVISPKSDVASSSTLTNAEFFRHPTGDRRDIDFGDASLNALDYRCCSINTDRYNVHRRFKKAIGPTTSTEGLKDNYMEFYLPINRQIRYENASEWPEGKNMYLVWWYSCGDGGTPAAAVRSQYRINKFFRDSRSCG